MSLCGCSDCTAPADSSSTTTAPAESSAPLGSLASSVSDVGTTPSVAASSCTTHSVAVSAESELLYLRSIGFRFASEDFAFQRLLEHLNLVGYCTLAVWEQTWCALGDICWEGPDPEWPEIFWHRFFEFAIHQYSPCVKWWPRIDDGCVWQRAFLELPLRYSKANLMRPKNQHDNRGSNRRYPCFCRIHSQVGVATFYK